eukprot:TRINITY_DN14865_c0_g1_i1.p1 TRINITY_DN14865_c0_g1~~TRINITY_DN14865_c0_g1_i1.p1  ORF type:complete len:926 (+),score=211.95 TRINITY_DN14865_c0_g1_i1:88-2778(+)
MPPAQMSIAVSGSPTYYVVMGTLHVLKDENLQKKKRGLVEYAKSVREEYPECNQSWAAQDMEDERLFHLYQEWSSEEHYRAACKLEPRRIMNGTPGYNLDHDEGLMLTYLKCTQYPLPDSEVPKTPHTRWAYMHKFADLTKREDGRPAGELFFLTLKGSRGKPDEHALFNNTSDKQFLARMRFPGQTMTPALDSKWVRKVKHDRGAGRTPDVAFEANVLPGHTVPFVTGHFTGKYGFSYRFGQPVDQDFLDSVAEKMHLDVQRDINDFKKFLREHMKATPGLMPPPPGATETERDHALYANDRFVAAATRICMDEGRPYVDLAWSPCQERISRTHAVPPEAPQPHRGWLRPQAWLEDNDFSLVQNTIEPGDIDQGELGDCWFMASIACCAEERLAEQLIMPIFHDLRRLQSADDKVRERYMIEHEREKSAGFFRIRLAKHGVWRWHVVDSYLPVTPVKKPGGPCFARNKEEPKEMWVSMLEKCYAKICGSYHAISGGDPAVALSDLTGFPCRTLDWKDPKCFARFQEHDSAGRMLWVTTPGQDTSAYAGGAKSAGAVEFAELYNSIGLVPGHAYTVVHVVEWPEGCSDGRTPKIQLMHIRNPWGNDKEWNKRWSDKDSAWDEHPEVAELCAKRCGVPVAQWNANRLGGESDDGCFWMAWMDVQHYFNGGGVCMRCEDNWQDLRLVTAFRDGIPEHIVRIEPTIDCHAYMWAQQTDRRGRLDKYRDLCALRMEIIVRKKKAADPKKQKYDLVATSNRVRTETGTSAGRFVATHQVTAFAHDTLLNHPLDLKRGECYYMIVRQYSNESRESLLNRDNIALVIMSSPEAGSSLRGVTPLLVSDAMRDSFRYQGYYGLDTRDAEPADNIFCQLNREQVWPRDGHQGVPVNPTVTSVAQLR